MDSGRSVNLVRWCLVLAGALLVSNGVTRTPARLFGSDNGSKHSAWAEISKERLLESIKILSSDRFGGRAPASKGEALATAYI